MSYRGMIGDITEIRRNGDVFSSEWRILNFLSLAGKGSDGFESPIFDSCDGRWCYVINPNGWYENSQTEWVHLYLFRVDQGPAKTFNMTVGIRGTEGVEKKRERLQELSANDRACFWNRFCSRLELGEQKSRLMPGDALIISLDMKIDMPSIPRDSFTQTAEEFSEDEVPTEKNQSLLMQGIEKLSEDISKLLVSRENSDVTMQVGDVEFKAHRAILSARCPVLSAMFRHETSEKASNRITIIDCEPEVFEDFLHYLYKGSAQPLSEKNVFGLYRVADKYLADDLKQQCLQYIQCTLSVQTFCNAVRLALMYGQRGLLEQAMDFATQNIKFIIRTVEWQNFNIDHPTEATEILIKALGPPS